MRIILFFNAFFFLILANISYAQPLTRYAFEHPQMGTQFKIIFYAPSTASAQAIANECIAKIDTLNAQFSDYDLSSELSQLSATAGTGQRVKVSKDLWSVIRQAQRYAQKSKGAFDISIGPLSKLWRSMFRKQEIFDVVKINTKKALVNYRKIKLHRLTKKVRLTRKGMRLDLGGIAKGYTVDEIGKILKKRGFTQFLIDGGGDILVGAPPPDQAGWRIRITTHDDLEQKVEQTILLKYQAIASSGDTYRFLEWGGQRYSHIIDPRTGYGVVNQSIINVQASTCTQADAIASTLSVLTVAEKKEYLKKWRKIKVF